MAAYRLAPEKCFVVNGLQKPFETTTRWYDDQWTIWREVGLPYSLIVKTIMVEETMEALLTVIMLWLSANFDLQQSFSHPAIVVESSANIHALYHGDHSAYLQHGTPHRDGQPNQVVAVYADATSTIHLSEGWTGTTPEELSILVHEMAHHLQKVGGQSYECPQEREKLAFAAQEQWLAMFGGSLLESFGLDPFTLLVRTNCGY